MNNKNILLNIFAPIVFVIIFLSIFTITENALYESYNYWVEDIESKPLIVFFYEDDYDIQLKEVLSKHEVISFFKIESGEEVFHDLITNYSLDELHGIVDISQLPSVLKIGFDGNNFSTGKYDKVKILVTENIGDKSFIVDISNELHNSYYEFKVRLFLYRIHVILKSLILFIFVFLSDKNYLYLTKEYWRIYYKAGGVRNRYLNYVKYFLLRFFVPFILWGLLIFIVTANYLTELEFNCKIWLLFTGLIITANQIAWLTFKDED